jgi:Fur family transcriptional regulator, peroxide stress response regulator
MNVADFLREKGIQPSQQRIRIYEALAAVKTHPAADTIYRELSPEMPTLSRTTVFSTLDLFARRGIAQRLALSGTELRYDADTRAHVHFRCRSCGAVSDLLGLRAPSLPKAPEGYLVESSQFYAEGLCPACSAREPAEGRD